MACSCSHNYENTENPQNYLKITQIYSYDFKTHRDVNFHQDYNVEKENIEDDPDSVKETNIIGEDVLFVDGNDADIDACEYEDTLMERVWQSCKPPEIPKKTCGVPARRIQIIEERLSSTVKKFPTLSQDLHDEVKKNVKRKILLHGDVDYVTTNTFDEKVRASCQNKTYNIVPACAQKLGAIL